MEHISNKLIKALVYSTVAMVVSFVLCIFFGTFEFQTPSNILSVVTEVAFAISFACGCAFVVKMAKQAFKEK